MAEIKVSAEREYVVRLTGDWRGDLSPIASKRDRVAVIYSAAQVSSMPTFSFGSSDVTVIEIPDGEAGKSPITLNYIWDRLAAAGFTRSDLIVGIGGGTVTDISGYAAASWLRGIDWVAIPTTLAGMVDAAVGGKTGINSPYGKNLIGAFHSPVSVIVDTSWLKTLSDRDFAAGLAEVIKCGFIDDPKILSLIDSKSLAQLRHDSALVTELISRSISTKAKVVSEDFKESELREILNYGHTFGHAVELLSGYSLRHGECVSIGLAYIAYLSERLGIITSELAQEHISILSHLGLPVTYKESQWPELLAAMKIDKKSRGNTLRFVVITAIGKTQRLENPNESELLAAYERLCQ